MSSKKTSLYTLTSFFKWLDEKALLLMSAFLLGFIPLYPKIPLFNLIESYIVRARLEDIFIFITFGLYFSQVIRKKITLRTPLTFFVLAYLSVGLWSIVSAVFIIPTVPLEFLHVGKTVLHYLRYIEYFSLFFIVFSAVKTKSDVQLLLGVILATVLGVSFYGFGQQHYKWPVFSTMNREYSKGVALELVDKNARVQSTFAGHYDFAAYLVVVLPVVLSLVYLAKKRPTKTILSGIFVVGLWALMTSASRSSLAGYALGVMVTTFVVAFTKVTWKERITWGASRALLVGLATIVLMLSFGGNARVLIEHSLNKYPAVGRLYTASVGSIARLFSEKTKDGGDQVVLPQHVLPQPKTEAPTDLKIPADLNASSLSVLENTLITPSGRLIVHREVLAPQLSSCTTKHSLSLCIRFDSLWPQALAGFKANPLLGSGYGTLNKRDFHHFSEADGTDNNYLRVLGETGVLGFISFFTIIVVSVIASIRNLKHSDKLVNFLSAGYLGATAGLLLNAALIDVFAASKVAYTYWSLTGLVLVAGTLKPSKRKKELALWSIPNITTALGALAFTALLAFGSWYTVSRNQKQPVIEPQKPVFSKRFILMGDTGSGSNGQQAVADSIEQHCQNSGNCEAVFILGDLIYEEGISSATDPQLVTKFEEPYKNIDLPFYAVLGNHDYLGCSDCYFEYANSSEKLNLPGPYYSQRYGDVVSFIFLDTEQLNQTQLAWLAEQLEISPSTFTVVLGHRPLVSFEATKINENWNGKSELSDLLCDQSQLYVSGHAHILEDNGLLPGCETRLLTSGTGGSYPRKIVGNPEGFHFSGNGFVSLLVEQDQMEYSFFDREGTLLHQDVVTLQSQQ